MELDRHKLQEERQWRTEFFQGAVQRVINCIEDALKVEVKRAVTRELNYATDLRDKHTHSDMARQIQHAIIQAVNNADLAGMMELASELTTVEEAIAALDRLYAKLPEELAAPLREREDRALSARKAKRELEAQERIDRKNAQCVASVHDAGRGVGFHQCAKKGARTVNGLFLCGQHATLEEKRRGSVQRYVPEQRRLDTRPRGALGSTKQITSGT